MTALAAGLVLSACAAGTQSAGAPGTGGVSGANSASGTGSAPAPAAPSVPERDLSAAEKKAIMDAVAPNLKDPGSAKYHWTKFPARTEGASRNYCATVDAKSPYPPYNGKQAYIVEVRLANGQVTGATMGLIAGGKDAAIVGTMCAKYDLDPNKAN
jgi:hypothetical protein